LGQYLAVPAQRCAESKAADAVAATAAEAVKSMQPQGTEGVCVKKTNRSGSHKARHPYTKQSPPTATRRRRTRAAATETLPAFVVTPLPPPPLPPAVPSVTN